jgi:hypothetical protein
VTVTRIRRASIFRVVEQYKQRVSRVYLATCFTVVSCFAFSSTIKIEAICSSETSVYFQRTTRLYILGYKIYASFFSTKILRTLLVSESIYRYSRDMISLFSIYGAFNRACTYTRCTSSKLTVYFIWKNSDMVFLKFASRPEFRKSWKLKQIPSKSVRSSVSIQ